MENDENKIPWAPIEARLAKMERKIPWLADRLGVDKNAIYNWTKRGGVPMTYLPQLMKELGLSADELMPNVSINSRIRDQNQPLSEEAEMLIRCVRRLDGLGDLARKTFVLHARLLLLAQHGTTIQDTFTGQEWLTQAEEEAEERLRNRKIGGEDAGTRQHRRR
ncbi:helix-turn-helix domain-containing protein [Paraburkholderia atlantica]|uniref:helix-turn-helix domain-containing protein n=1 Tax=Paraburkholderia atlantica TaxID=2654982 RepID=UPI00161C2864|nr:helix-turn-helix domain-containing protein [Paraburkholderia atlantica]MBB5509592.1 hypothetical protein [Paraburkholderia atlantica]